MNTRRDTKTAEPTITPETGCSETFCLSKREAKPPNFIVSKRCCRKREKGMKNMQKIYGTVRRDLPPLGGETQHKGASRSALQSDSTPFEKNRFGMKK